MKASSLIKYLEKMIDLFGDCEVTIFEGKRQVSFGEIYIATINKVKTFQLN